MDNYYPLYKLNISWCCHLNSASNWLLDNLMKGSLEQARATANPVVWACNRFRNQWSAVNRIKSFSDWFSTGWTFTSLLSQKGSSLHEEILSICLFVRHHFLFSKIVRAFPCLFFFSLANIQLSGLVWRFDRTAGFSGMNSPIGSEFRCFMYLALER